MTGGMLGLAGSTGVASAANNGGSRKISIEQMPSHTHNLYNGYGDNVAGIQVLYWINRPSLGSTAWLSSTFTQSTGGVRIIFPHIPPFMVGEELLNKVGEC